MDEHPDNAVDLQNPDEARPAKRVRLEQLDAPLTLTEEVQHEVMDDDDWDDVYGDPNAAAVAKSTPLQSGVPTSDTGPTDTHTSPSTSHEHQFGVSDKKPEDAKQENAPDGVPPEAISEGDDLVAPPPHPLPENNDKASIDVMEETTETEFKPPEPAQAVKQEQTDQTSGDAHLPKGSDGLLDQLMSDVQPTISQPKATDDPEFMKAAAAQKGNENAEWQFDSSDAESSSDSDTTDSDDSSDESDAGSDADYEMLDPATAAKILMSEEGNDGENTKPGVDRQPRTQNEVKEEVVPKPDITVTPEMKTTLLGHVENVVENMVLIKGATPGEYQVLEGESVLCDENKKVLGRVRDTFGRVQEPMYSMAFTNAAEIKESGLESGSKVFYVNDHSTFVFTQPLRNMKGTDASNIHDEEIAEDEQEFSDDEKEAEYKRQKKLAKKSGREGLSRSAFESGERIPTASGPGAGPRSDVPAQSYGGLSYDDDDDMEQDFYQPLKRPDNLSQLMASGAPPLRQQQPFGDRGRGRGRGDRGRGRGDRGRGDRGRGRGGGFEQRNQRGGRGGPASNQQQHHQQHEAGHRGNARTFPDRHNSSGPQPSPAAPNSHQQMPGQGYYQQQMPQPFQNSGFQFPQGNQPAANASQYGYYGQYNQQPAAGPPPGAHVNPAFFQQQGYQHPQGQYQQYQQYSQPQQQQQAFAQPQATAGAQQTGPIDIGAILAQLQGQQPQR